MEVGQKMLHSVLTAPNLTLEKIAMKKTLIALAVLATSGAAMAQSTFTLYGIADANVEHIKGNGSINRLSSGGLNGSRFGLRGSEDLGGGLKGVFQIENGFTIDNGQLAQGGRLFGRQAYLGVEGSFGTVRLGRQYSSIGNVADMVGTKPYDVLAVTKTLSGGNNGGTLTDVYRVDNAATYRTPSLSGFTAEVQYSLTTNGAESSSKDGRALSFNGIYANGPIRAALGYIALDDVNAAIVGNQKRSELLVVAGYDFGVTNLTGYMTETEVGTASAKAPSKMNVYGLSAAFPMGAITLTPGVAMAQDVNGGQSTAKEEAIFYTLQAKYDLSKRTALYSNITAVDNKDGAQLGFNAPNLGGTSYGVQFGVRHSF
jgi:predicted porin